MTITIGLFSHATAAVGFATLALVLLAGRRDGDRLAIALASLLSAAWAGAYLFAGGHGLSGDSGHAGHEAFSQLETLRSAAWIAVLLWLLKDGLGFSRRPSSSFLVAALLGFVVTLQLVLEGLADVSPLMPLRQQPVGATLFVAARLVVAISGLVLVHNLYINSRDQLSLSPRLLCVALATLFAYDLNLYTLQFLLGVQNLDLHEMRGLVDALVVPLVWLALRRDRLARLRLSRQMAFQSVSVMAIGLYLIAMSLLAYGLRLTGGSWGELLQVLFLVGALIAGALVALSPRVRAEVREKILRNFYSYRYDYRQEWVRFLATIDGAADRTNHGGNVASHSLQPLRERFVMATARVIDSPGGVLLEPADNGGFEAAARWNWGAADAPRIPEGSALALTLAESGRMIAFDAVRAGQVRGLTLPDWAVADPRIAAAVPLLRQDRLCGILLLRRPLTARALDWEDQELLGTLGRQGASYLAEAATLARLEESRQFDDFNRRFAFIMHDVKNVVSQVGLVARNAERHADNPAFRADMVATLNASVTKMTDLLALLGKSSGRGGPVDGEADLTRIATTVVAAKRRGHVALELEGADAPLPLPGDPDRLEAMLHHLVQNAIDASAPDAPVSVRVMRQAGAARLTIADRGHGMTRAFIRDELFKPFRSTKANGFGIGAFEAREIVHQHGGRLDVTSRPGEGSEFTISLPLTRQAARGVRS